MQLEDLDLDLDTVVDNIESAEFDEIITTDLDEDEGITVITDEVVDDITDKEAKEIEDAVVPVVAAKVNKAELARAIFKEHYGQPGVARKDIIKLFEAIGLTKAGAATYYQKETAKLKVPA